MTTTTAHFGIDFDFMTSHVRRLWAEHSFDKAYDLLSDVPDKPMRDAIIMGTMKIVQDPDGIQGCEAIVVKDAWIPNLDLCQYGEYPDPKDLDSYYERVQEKSEVEFETKVEDLKRCINQWNRSVATWDYENLESLNFVFKQFDAEVFEKLGVSKSDLVDNNYYQIELPNYPNQPYLTATTTKFDEMENKLNAIVDKNLARRGDMFDTVVENMLEDVVAETTTDLSSKHGLVSPTGEFYPCKYMQHDDLAYALDTTQDKLQRQGWVAISSLKFSGDGKPDFKYDQRATITQPTLNTLFDWSMLHDAFDIYQSFLTGLD